MIEITRETLKEFGYNFRKNCIIDSRRMQIFNDENKYIKFYEDENVEIGIFGESSPYYYGKCNDLKKLKLVLNKINF